MEGPRSGIVGYIYVCRLRRYMISLVNLLLEPPEDGQFIVFFHRKIALWVEFQQVERHLSSERHVRIFFLGQIYVGSGRKTIMVAIVACFRAILHAEIMHFVSSL